MKLLCAMALQAILRGNREPGPKILCIFRLKRVKEIKVTYVRKGK